MTNEISLGGGSSSDLSPLSRYGPMLLVRLGVISISFGVFPDCERDSLHHDLTLESLRNCCVDFDNAFTSNRAVSDKLRKMLGQDGTEIGFGKLPSEDALKLVSEYVINSVEKLPKY